MGSSPGMLAASHLGITSSSFLLLQHLSLSFWSYSLSNTFPCLKYLKWLPYSPVLGLIQIYLLSGNPSGEGCKAEDMIPTLQKSIISLGNRTFKLRVNRTKYIYSRAHNKWHADHLCDGKAPGYFITNLICWGKERDGYLGTSFSMQSGLLSASPEAAPCPAHPSGLLNHFPFSGLPAPKPSLVPSGLPHSCSVSCSLTSGSLH